MIKFIKISMMLSLFASLYSCTIGRPLWGLGHAYNKRFKELNRNDFVYVGITHAYLNGGEAKFLSDTFKVYDDLDSFKGFLGGSVRKQIWGNQVWTMSVWHSEDDLKRFSYSDLHRRAIKSSGQYISKIRSTILKMKRVDVPESWQEIRGVIEPLDFKENNPNKQKSY